MTLGQDLLTSMKFLPDCLIAENQGKTYFLQSDVVLEKEFNSSQDFRALFFTKPGLRFDRGGPGGRGDECEGIR